MTTYRFDKDGNKFDPSKHGPIDNYSTNLLKTLNNINQIKNPTIKERLDKVLNGDKEITISETSLDPNDNNPGDHLNDKNGFAKTQ